MSFQFSNFGQWDSKVFYFGRQKAERVYCGLECNLVYYAPLVDCVFSYFCSRDFDIFVGLPFEKIRLLLLEDKNHSRDVYLVDVCGWDSRQYDIELIKNLLRIE